MNKKNPASTYDIISINEDDERYMEDEEEEESRSQHRELLSENYFSSQKKNDERNQRKNYMNRTSYTNNQKPNTRKYILESNVSPGGSEGISLISKSNQKYDSVIKSKNINRNKEFLSSSKYSNSEMFSSHKKQNLRNLKNMASIEHQNPYIDEYHLIEEASRSKEEFSKSRSNNINFISEEKKYPSYYNHETTSLG